MFSRYHKCKYLKQLYNVNHQSNEGGLKRGGVQPTRGREGANKSYHASFREALKLYNFLWDDTGDYAYNQNDWIHFVTGQMYWPFVTGQMHWPFIKANNQKN